ncbi:MAG TPA: hypothetical protein VGQ42_11205 [Candidatus Dormibacteraeota bacterium]|jgi:hypothetical protein|nr:hypothetical protein [Candidatus Dormibacteraeota bacterium]
MSEARSDRGPAGPRRDPLDDERERARQGGAEGGKHPGQDPAPGAERRPRDAGDVASHPTLGAPPDREEPEPGS